MYNEALHTTSQHPHICVGTYYTPPGWCQQPACGLLICHTELPNPPLVLWCIQYHTMHPTDQPEVKLRHGNSRKAHAE